MGLRDRFKENVRPAEPAEKDPHRARTNGNGNGNGHVATAPAPSLNDRSQGLKARIHRRMVERINLASLESVEPERLRFQIRQIISALLAEESIPLSEAERLALEEEVLNETFGLGPIEPYLHDPDVADILVNTHRQVYIERFGKLELTPTKFDNYEHVMRIIDRIVSRIGRRVDESSPMVDARLADGSRVNAIIPPLAIDGACMSIRKFSRDPLQLRNLIEKKSVTPEIGELMKGLVQTRLNTLISGGTGTGKTTILNILSGFISSTERIVTIEDAAELQLRQEHVVRLETRPSNIEGKGEVTQRELVKNALRMRPDRVILGEVRGPEAVSYTH